MKTKKKKVKKKNIRWLKLLLWFTSISKPLKYIFLLATILVLLFEFWISNVNMDSTWAHLINFFVKLSYSYISAFIFYLLAVHTPKERRKIKMILHISNTSTYLLTELRFFLDTFCVYVNLDKPINTRGLDNILNNYSPFSIVTSKSEEVTFVNWFGYYEWKATRVQKLIDTLLELSDFLNPEFIKYLIRIRASFDNVNMMYHRAKASPNMAFFLLVVLDLEYNIEQLKNHHISLRPYTDLYHDDIVKENRKRWAAETLLSNPEKTENV